MSSTYNYAVEFNANILALDVTVTPNFYAVNRLRDILYRAQDVIYNAFFQVTPTPMLVPFPSNLPTLQAVWVCNLGAGDVTVSFTPSGGTPQTLFLGGTGSYGLGGTFLYMNPSTNAGGITQLALSSLQGSSVELLVASGPNAGTIVPPIPPAPAPVITGISPLSGAAAGGTTVTITGGGFTSATGVTFGGASGTNLTVVSDSQITVTTPAGTAGAGASLRPPRAAGRPWGRPAPSRWSPPPR